MNKKFDLVHLIYAIILINGGLISVWSKQSLAQNSESYQELPQPQLLNTESYSQYTEPPCNSTQEKYTISSSQGYVTKCCPKGSYLSEIFSQVRGYRLLCVSGRGFE